VARFTFFLGKGGVGKTTISSAYALQRAGKYPRKKILLLSTDPAHSLSDVLQHQLSNAPKRLSTPGVLWARQLDAQKQIDSFLHAEREEMLTLLNKGSLFTRDELEPLLDTSLPGMAEVAALLAIQELLDSKFDEIVIDTAPMGHAIRLFQIPQHFARFLDVLEVAAARDVVLARHFGGHVQRETALERWSRMVERSEEVLSSAGSKLVLVTTAEPFSLDEAVRSMPAFESSGPRNVVTEVVLNRVVEIKTTCPRCRRKVQQARVARKFLATHFADAEVFVAPDPGGPILGIESLRAFGAHVFSGRKLSRSVVAKPAASRKVKLESAEWPRLATPLTLTLGKGGVGKTTLSAALGFHHRQVAKADAVSICSIDPAPSLDDVFASIVGDELRPVLGDKKFRAAEFDAIAQFEQWAGDLRDRLNRAMTGEERGIHLDLSLDRKFLLALLDIVPPGVDEIFATFRILDLLGEKQRVLIDMAPTGHALEVLRTPARLLAWARVLLKTLAAHRTLAIARDAAVEIASLSQNVRDLAAILKDKKRCRLVVVTLAEPLPDRETRLLLLALRELQAPLAAVFVNRVLLDSAGACRRCNLIKQWQAATLASFRRQLHDTDVYVVAEAVQPIAGAERLRQLTQKLWRLT
jgi:arsenite-transporting ATPase